MSLAEFEVAPGGYPPSFERTPPQDLTAEQGVLGGMLLSKDAIADVVEVLRPGDFYKPAHQTVYDAVLDLYSRGEPADPVTVSAELTRRGEIGRVGGGPYLHTLISSVPTAANASYYARIVRERAVLRRLVEAGTKIVQMGYSVDGGEADEIVDRAQAELYSVTERRTSEDYLPLSEIMQGTLDEIEAISSRGGAMIGVPTGFADLDQLTNGLHGGQLIVLAGRPAMGKALALDTALPTPTGWTTMGEVRLGDLLLDGNGRPTRVVAATEIMDGRPCYELTFSDGAVILADADHQWLTHTRSSRRAAAVGGAAAQVRTTEEIVASLRTGNRARRANHSVENTKALDLPDRQLPLPPYSLGVWLGDGMTNAAQLTSADPEIAMYVDAESACPACPSGAQSAGQPHGLSCRHRAGTIHELLASPGVPGNTNIPGDYLRSSQRQRRALLAGLLDARGTVSPEGVVQLALTSLVLAEQARELVVSLGYRCGFTQRAVPGTAEASATVYTLAFSTDEEVFRLRRKAMAHKELGARQLSSGGSRFITGARRVDSVPVRCVEVDNPEHLYLAGRSMIPTHNSTLGLDFCRAASIKHRLTSVIFSLEMGRNEITMRMLSAEARVALHHMRSGNMSDEDWTRLARTMSSVSEAPLYIDDSPNMSMMEIRAKCRRLKQRGDLRLVVIDYLQLMTSGKRVESRQQEVAEFSRSLKLLAKELDVPVVALSQLNRGPEQRTDKRPQLSDLRESGAIEQDADMVILLHRDDAYERESPRAGEADLIVAKHRNGPTSNVVVAFQGHYSRFVDMAQS